MMSNSNTVANWHAETLVTLASNIDIPIEDIDISIIRSTLRATTTEPTAADIPN